MSGKPRPAWAKTSEEVDEELVEFAQELNFEKYLEDLEFRELCSALKTRISQIDDNQEELGELAPAESTLGPAEAEAQPEVPRTPVLRTLKLPPARVRPPSPPPPPPVAASSATKVTSFLLRTLRTKFSQVHSRKSAQALVDQVKEGPALAPVDPPSMAALVPERLPVTPSQLPYLYRNPRV